MSLQIEAASKSGKPHRQSITHRRRQHFGPPLQGIVLLAHGAASVAKIADVESVRTA
jgi:hypothetical protein